MREGGRKGGIGRRRREKGRESSCSDERESRGVGVGTSKLLG